MPNGCGRFTALGVAGVVLLACAAQGEAADPARGGRLAETWCSGCHAVAPEQRQATDAVPTFEQIGKSYDEASLAAFLADPSHSRMVNLSLSRDEIADLVAYIRLQAP
jgi:mono/diheme cytochrome c family protein